MAMAGHDKLSGKTYLVVEDSTVMRRIIKNCLVGFGIPEAQMAEAGDGLEALRVAEARPIDCIVADWNMPNCDGLEFLKELRTRRGHEHTPFLMLTTEASRAAVLEAIRAGVSAYLVKPVNPALLRQRLEEVFP